MITKIQNRKPVFLDQFEREEDVYSEFEVFSFGRYPSKESPVPAKPKNIKILFAYYSYEDYSGDAFVLYFDRSDKKLYEVNGSHCSCYGLEDQWSPEEVVMPELIKRAVNMTHRDWAPQVAQ